MTVAPFAATSDSTTFVDVDVSMWHWAGLLAVIVALLAVDLALHRGNHEPTTKRAVIESSVWIGCGLAFSTVVLAMWAARRSPNT